MPTTNAVPSVTFRLRGAELEKRTARATFTAALAREAKIAPTPATVGEILSPASSACWRGAPPHRPPRTSRWT